MTTHQALLLLFALKKAVQTAFDKREKTVDVVAVLQAADDAARDELQAAIEAAQAAIGPGKAADVAE